MCPGWGFWWVQFLSATSALHDKEILRNADTVHIVPVRRLLRFWVFLDVTTSKIMLNATEVAWSPIVCRLHSMWSRNAFDAVYLLLCVAEQMPSSTELVMTQTSKSCSISNPCKLIVPYTLGPMTLSSGYSDMELNKVPYMSVSPRSPPRKLSYARRLVKERGFL